MLSVLVVEIGVAAQRVERCSQHQEPNTMDIFRIKALASNSLEEVAKDEEEEKSLAEHATGRTALHATGVLELTMKLSAVDLKVYHNEKGFKSLLCVDYRPSIPRIANKSQLGRLLWAMTISRPMVIGRVLFVSVSTILLALSVYLLYQHDKLVKELESSIPNFDSRQSECVRLENFEPNQAEKVKDLEDMKRQISKLGIIFTNLPGQGVINLGTVGLLPLAFFFLTQILLSKQLICCDLLCFLFWPVLERKRVIDDVHSIIDELVTSIRNRQFLRFRPKTQSELIVSSSLRQKSDDVHFLQLLLKIDIFRWVQPISVSSRWYQKLSSSFGAMMSFSIFMAAIVPAVSSFLLITLDIVARTSMRRQQMECIRLQEDSFLLKIPYDFRKFSAEEREAYTSYDGSLSGYMYLFLHIEVGHYFSFSTCLFLFCYSGLLSHVFFWGTFYVNTFIFASMDKVVWIAQLDDEITECLKFSRLRSGLGNNWNDKEYQQLNKLLTISYLNYELFRRQYRRYMVLGKFFLIQGSMIGFVGLLLFYFIGTNIETKGTSLIIYTCAAISGLINIYLMAASVVSKKMEKITTNIANLLGHLTNSRMVHSYPVELWRRQALSDREIRSFYALQLFGRSLSYKDLVSFNLHVIMLVLVLMKINNKYSTKASSSYGR